MYFNNVCQEMWLLWSIPSACYFQVWISVNVMEFVSFVTPCIRWGHISVQLKFSLLCKLNTDLHVHLSGVLHVSNTSSSKTPVIHHLMKWKTWSSSCWEKSLDPEVLPTVTLDAFIFPWLYLVLSICYVTSTNLSNQGTLTFRHRISSI